jgi:hypothetical protein
VPTNQQIVQDIRICPEMVADIFFLLVRVNFPSASRVSFGCTVQAIIVSSCTVIIIPRNCGIIIIVQKHCWTRILPQQVLADTVEKCFLDRFGVDPHGVVAPPYFPDHGLILAGSCGWDAIGELSSEKRTGIFSVPIDRRDHCKEHLITHILDRTQPRTRCGCFLTQQPEGRVNRLQKS